jgi:hypothetical protein
LTAPRLIVLCFDALDWNLIGDDYESLRLVTGGRTDISEFRLPRSVILWSSFLTSRNMEIYLKDMLYEFELGFIRLRIPPHIGDRFERRIWGGWSGRVLGKLAPLRKYLKERIWRVRLRPGETFLRYFGSYKAIDMVALTHKKRRHKKERELIGDYFNYDVEEGILERLRELIYSFNYGGGQNRLNSKGSASKRDDTERVYRRYVWDGYRESREELLSHLERGHEIVLFFTPLADLIGHLNFGSEEEMREVYSEFNSLVGRVVDRFRDEDTTIIGLSDHGMERVLLKSRDGGTIYTKYGDHSEVRNGAYFLNRTVDEIKGRYTALQKDPDLSPDQYERSKIEEAIGRLDEGTPTLRDFYHLIRVFGGRNPPQPRRRFYRDERRHEPAL